MKTRKLFLLCLLLLFPGSRAGADSYPAPVYLDVAHVRQENTRWCWLAVAEMVVAYKNHGQAPSQCALMEIGFGHAQGYCCADPGRCNGGGSLEEVARIIAFFSHRRTFLTEPLTVDQLYGYLARDGIVVARVVAAPFGAPANAPESGHQIVLRGLRYGWIEVAGPDGRAWKEFHPLVLVNDPGAPAPQEVPYQIVRQHWERSLLVE